MERLSWVMSDAFLSDYIDEVLQEDDETPRRDNDDGGITFTAKSPRRYSA